MPKTRYLYLHIERNRHGNVAYYFRKGKGPRVRIRGEYGSKEFTAAYESALKGERPAPSRRVSTKSLAWLIEQYKQSSEWSRLSKATRDQRDNILYNLVKSSGHEPFDDVNKESIVAGRDKRRHTPNQANNFIKSMRSLFKWAVEANHVNDNPADGVRLIPIKTDGYHTWTEEEVAQFEEHWPIGTRERLAMTILLYTGLRRGDAARLGPQHVQGGVINLATEKTGTEVSIPILPELAEVISATKTGKTAFVAKPDGGPMTKESFGTWFMEACKAAKVPGRAHGLRKAGATRAAENGATETQLEAIFGWEGGGMASLYTKKANRRKTSREAIGKLSKK